MLYCDRIDKKAGELQKHCLLIAFNISGGDLMYHIWTLDNWEKNIDFNDKNHRTGFRLRFDKNVDPEVRRACKEFAAFLRREYYFPLRVVAYIKDKPKLRCIYI